MAKQISIFAEDEPGKIKDISKFLGDNKINIKAITIDRGSEYGIIKLLVDKPNKAINIFKKNKIHVKTTQVIVVEIKKSTGSILEITNLLSKNGINIEDAYGFVVKDSHASVLVLEVVNIKSVIKILKNNNIKVLSSKKIYNL